MKKYKLKTTDQRRIPKPLMFIFSLSLLWIFPCNVYAVVHANARDNLVIISECIEPLTKCYDVDSGAKYREMCINGFRTDRCPGETTYLCGYDDTVQYLIEKCVEPKECRPGTSLAYVVESGSLNVTLTCLPCIKEQFETQYTLSSHTSHTNGCPYVHMSAENVSSHLVLHRQGTKSSATEWYCDAESCYYEKHGNMLCDDVPTHKCNCVGKTCIAGHLLRPDGKCLRCHTKLDPKDNWRCQDERLMRTSLQDYQTTPEVPSRTGTAESLRTNTEMYFPQMQNTSTANDQESTGIGSTIGIVLAIVIACIAAIVVFLSWKFIYRKKQGLKAKAQEKKQEPDEVVGQRQIQNISYHINANNVVVGENAQLYDVNYEIGSSRTFVPEDPERESQTSVELLSHYMDGLKQPNLESDSINESIDEEQTFLKAVV